MNSRGIDYSYLVDKLAGDFEPVYPEVNNWYNHDHDAVSLPDGVLEDINSYIDGLRQGVTFTFPSSIYHFNPPKK